MAIDMYRYSAEEYNQSLLKMGGVRVGTLHDFRKSEHKEGIADPQEGKKQVSHFIDKAVVNSATDLHSKAAKEFNIIDPGKNNVNMHLENVTFSKSFDEPDCFILCVSSKKSREVMAEFEGADSCVEIIEPNIFFQQLTITLNLFTPVIFRGVHKVIYQNKKEVWNGQDWGHNPAVIKELEFKDQYELRAIWQPRFNQKISPIIFNNYKLISVCRKVAI